MIKKLRKSLLLMACSSFFVASHSASALLNNNDTHDHVSSSELLLADVASEFNSHDHDSWVAINSLSTLTSIADGGFYYLTADVNVTTYLSFNNASFTLCLNGHTLARGSSYYSSYLFELYDGSVVNITDCADSQGRIAGNGTFVSSGASFYLNQSTLNLYGGAIGNYSSLGAGELHLENSTFNMYGGYLGDFIYDDNSSISIKGGYLSSDIVETVSSYLDNDLVTVDVSSYDMNIDAFYLEDFSYGVYTNGGSISFDNVEVSTSCLADYVLLYFGTYSYENAAYSYVDNSGTTVNDELPTEVGTYSLTVTFGGVIDLENKVYYTSETESIFTVTIANHVYGNWQVDVEATEDEEGSQSHTCSVCGYVDVEAIPLIVNDYTYFGLIVALIFLIVLFALAILVLVPYLAVTVIKGRETNYFTYASYNNLVASNHEKFLDDVIKYTLAEEGSEEKTAFSVKTFRTAKGDVLLKIKLSKGLPPIALFKTNNLLVNYRKPKGYNDKNTVKVYLNEQESVDMTKKLIDLTKEHYKILETQRKEEEKAKEAAYKAKVLARKAKEEEKAKFEGLTPKEVRAKKLAMKVWAKEEKAALKAGLSLEEIAAMDLETLKATNAKTNEEKLAAKEEAKAVKLKEKMKLKEEKAAKKAKEKEEAKARKLAAKEEAKKEVLGEIESFLKGKNTLKKEKAKEKEATLKEEKAAEKARLKEEKAMAKQKGADEEE